MAKVLFPQKDLSGQAEPGQPVHEALRRLGHAVEQVCGGNALCGTCCVIVCEGDEYLTPPGRAEVSRLAELGLGPPHRLACQARVASGTGEIRIVAC
ncbi:MAG TPA: 2Fe-2S iron-sulfur cluster-binding protein [Candidatus Polarisedimenticolia bacterium]|nr:2Fe-2S iron-sulfur cluster-binding protein [Candidatus Polarisedimenticolia bacterium]